jgi:hypothetical protein
MVRRLFGMMAVVCLHAAMASDSDRSRIVAIQAGATLSSCQTFRWRSPLPNARVNLMVGSCRGCKDIAERQEANDFSFTLSLPSDGRDIHVNLTTVVDDVVIGHDEQVYRAISAPEDAKLVAQCETRPESTVGIYHWSGKAARSLTQGVQAVAEMGGSAIRLVLSARSGLDYNLGPRCLDDFRLAEFLGDSDVKQSLANNSIRTYMLTVYDGTSFHDCEKQLFLHPQFYSPENRTRLIQEYSDFAYELIRAHAHSGKTFIVSNWESDNAIYCGSSYSYTSNAEFRRMCDAEYPSYYGGNAGPAQSLAGLREWFTARWEGVAHGRRRAEAEGFDGVAVYLAPEINSVRDLREAGLASVLTDVLPFVPFDYVSYSSWESLNRGGAREELAVDMDTIRTIARTDGIIIGEIGYPSGRFGDAAVDRTVSALATAAKWGARYLFHWVLYDDASASGHGLYDVNGALTPMGAYFKSTGFRIVPPVRNSVSGPTE